MAEPWDAQLAGTGLLAAVTRAITEERARFQGLARPLRDSDLARAVLRSPALRESCMRTVDATLEEYKPRIAEQAVAAANEILGPVLLSLYQDLRHLMKDYSGPGEVAIAATPFAASVDQVFLEKYGVEIPEARAEEAAPSGSVQEPLS